MHHIITYSATKTVRPKHEAYFCIGNQNEGDLGDRLDLSCTQRTSRSVTEAASRLYVCLQSHQYASREIELPEKKKRLFFFLHPFQHHGSREIQTLCFTSQCFIRHVHNVYTIFCVIGNKYFIMTHEPSRYTSTTYDTGHRHPYITIFNLPVLSNPLLHLFSGTIRTLLVIFFPQCASLSNYVAFIRMQVCSRSTSTGLPWAQFLDATQVNHIQ
jgi:hypothetical protein